MLYRRCLNLLGTPIVVIALAALLATCGGMVNGGGDSSTHWLQKCNDDGDCGSLSCLCGVCSRSCGSERQCGSLDSDAICAEPADCAAAGSMCTLACGGGEDCHDGLCLGEECTSSVTDAGPPVNDIEQTTVGELCENPSEWFGRSFELDPSGSVETRQVGTGGFCPTDGGVVCCNWTWTVYVLPCPDGDIVFTEEGAPFGTAVAPAGLDSDWEPTDVTIGCQGMDCGPTCVPESAESFGRIRARLEPAEDGWVTPDSTFEPFDGQAALVIEADLSGSMPSGVNECLDLEQRFTEAWTEARRCDVDEDCVTDYSGLCTVQFESGQRFDCDLPLNRNADATQVRSIEEQYRASCDPGADCDCSLRPSACIDGLCEVVEGPSMSEVGPNVAELCEDPSEWFGRTFDIDLSGAVEMQSIATAIGCVPDAGAPECCVNWEWTAYLLRCPGGDIVFTEEGAPFGTAVAPAEDDEWGPADVTMGCQGMECSPTCVPASADGFGRVRARLEPAEDGVVTPDPTFEPFDGQAALVIEADLPD